MLYIEMAQLDLQREFHLARSHPRHLTPLPPTHHATHQQTATGVLDSLLLTQHALEMFRRTLSNATLRRSYDRLANRLSKILSEARKLAAPPK